MVQADWPRSLQPCWGQCSHFCLHISLIPFWPKWAHQLYQLPLLVQPILTEKGLKVDNKCRVWELLWGEGCEWLEQEELSRSKWKACGCGQSGENYPGHEHHGAALLLCSALRLTPTKHPARLQWQELFFFLFLLVSKLSPLQRSGSLWKFCVATSPSTHSTSNPVMTSPLISAWARGVRAAAEGVCGKEAQRQCQTAKICTSNLAVVQTSH